MDSFLNYEKEFNTQESISSMSSQMKIAINLNEKDIIKLIIEFLANRELNICMLDLERETGVINAAYSDDILFLRQLVLDGQWDDAIEFIQPLRQIDTFNFKHFNYLILKYQYLELLCLKSEANVNTNVNQLSVDQLVNYLNELRPYCPNDDEYKKLCLLLTSPRLQDHNEFKNWNPSSGRLECFKEILPLVADFLALGESTSNSKPISQNDRLLQLIVKGLLYESCVEYCQARATQSTETYQLNDPNILLVQTQLSETDASLLSWLHALQTETFSCPFEEKPLKLNLNKFIKPNLEAIWADAILATPIKPKQLFPYNAVPSGRSKNTELMSRSLAPQYDGLSFGLNKSQIFTSGIELQLNNSLSQQANQKSSNHSANVPNAKNKSNYQQDLNNLTHSIALFNLQSSTKTDNYKQFSRETDYHQNIPQNVNSYMNVHKISTVLNEIKEEDPSLSLLNDTNENKLEDEKSTLKMNNIKNNPMTDSSLFKEYQKNKAQILQKLEEQDKKREEFIKQLKEPNVKNALSEVSINNIQRNKVNSTKNDVLLSPDLNYVSPVNENDLNKQSGQITKSNSSSSNELSPINISPNNANFNHSNKNTHDQHFRSNTTILNNSQSKTMNDKLKYDSVEDILFKESTFIPICSLEDQQAIRAVDIHPNGSFYAVGSNSKCLRICQFPNVDGISSDHSCMQASVFYKKSKHHYGSIYCIGWNKLGNLIATGSNDKTIKIIKFNPEGVEENDSEIELTYHNGTIRDLIFMQQEDNNLLVSGGAGDCKIHVFDCHTQQTLRVYSGHNAHIYTLFTWSGTKNVFVSGSQDKTCRFWDLRTPESIQLVAPSTSLGLLGSPVASVAVDPSGLLLSSGHEDSACCLYDIRGSRIVQIYKPHTKDIRSVRFSSNAYYLLTASYDNKVNITDLHGDLTKPLNWNMVASHNDKVIQAKWHPNSMSFITTSADRTSTVWGISSSLK